MKVSANLNGSRERPVTISHEQRLLHVTFAEAGELVAKLTEILSWVTVDSSATASMEVTKEDAPRIQGAKLRAMQLHDELVLPGGIWTVTRVPGGWIYTHKEEKGPAVFVPLDKSWNCAAEM